jgi:predicted short-subunit dehydrogenase-like oxidoreductase (DUF2520 family)
MRVFVFGAGKLGRSLAVRLKKAGAHVTIRAARDGLPKKPIDADVLVLAVRDRDLLPVATRLRDAKLVMKKTVCVHVAGGMVAEAIGPLQAVSKGIAQMHPMIAFASVDFAPSLVGGGVHVQGDPAAVAKATSLAKLLKMKPRTFKNLDVVAYHAAAGLVANGTAALAALGAELLVRANVPRKIVPELLGPLLRTVAENVEALGFPSALTGPVRRGDVGSVSKAAAVLQAKLPEALPLYIATVEAQIPLARTIGDAPPHAFDAIAAVLRGQRPG